MDQLRLRVCNLRCLADTKSLDIKPITLLVGTNNSGKSTFLRVFPLLHQSVSTQTLSGLLLNEGDVNFGFFSEAVHKDATPQEMRLELTVTLRPGVFQGTLANRYLSDPLPVTCALTYAKRDEDSRYPYLQTVELTLHTGEQPDYIKIVSDEDGTVKRLEANQFKLNGEASELRLRVGRGLVPSLIRTFEKKNTEEQFEDTESEPGIFDRRLLEATDYIFHGRTMYETRLAVFQSVRLGSPDRMLASMQAITDVNSWHQKVSSWETSSPFYKKIRDLFIARFVANLLTSLNVSITQLARSVHYFAPVRAGVERDYLSRDVPVARVDSRGANVAMFLSALDRPSLERFREWTRNHFKFEVFPKSVGDGARIALRLKEEHSGVEFNLADMGFGFSQMLPFLVQIWSFSEREFQRGRTRFVSILNRDNRSIISNSAIIAIEQPELHLHPALQARLADLFVTTARLSKDRELPIRFILETHSPTIIERIGQLIEAGSIQAEDVQVLHFERTNDGQSANTSTVRKSWFDERGILQDWPIGFFLAPQDPPSGPIKPSPKDS